MGKNWQASLPLTLLTLDYEEYEGGNHFASVNANKLLVKTKLNSRIPLLFPYDSRIPPP